MTDRIGYRTISIGRIAHESAWDAIEEQAMRHDSSPAQREGYEAWRTARLTKNSAWITTNLEAWKFLLTELTYRWEVSGGNGNPYGIDDLQHYQRERESCARAVKRVAKEMNA